MSMVWLPALLCPGSQAAAHTYEPELQGFDYPYPVQSFAYPALAQQAAAVIPRATLVQFPDLGHAPQIADPGRFHAALLGWLTR